MSAVGVILGLGPLRGERKDPDRAAKVPVASVVAAAARAAIDAGLDDVIVVVEDESQLSSLPDDVAVILDQSKRGPAAGLRCAIDHAQRVGFDQMVVAFPSAGPRDRSLENPRAWRSLSGTKAGRIAIGTSGGGRRALLGLGADLWPLAPLEGALEGLASEHRDLVEEIELDLGVPGIGSVPARRVSEEDVAAVTELLGRRPQGEFSVAVRDADGVPLVIENAPFLDDGTPMPTRYWLVGRRARDGVGRLESNGGVREAEAAIDPAEISAAHEAYAKERDALVDPTHAGPRPSGGVGGTRQGVKCLHAHLASYLAGSGDPVGRWTAARLVGEIDGPVAAIDCGTNSTRLLVLDTNGVTLAREAIITRLGEGVDATGSLSPKAIDRVLDALRQYRRTCDHYGVVAVRATATSAARDASNSEDFFGPAESVIGVRPELIKGAEEGRLSYLGATGDAPAGHYLVVDLGGGSTELIAGDEHGEIGAVISLDIGCVRITERFLASDPPGADELAAARTYVAGVLSDALGKLPALREPKSMIGVAGTISTLAALSLGLSEYDSDAVHHARLDRAQVVALFEKLASMDGATRRELPGIESGRADVIVGGALVLDEVMKATGHDVLMHSEHDILDGIATELLAAQHSRS